MTESQRTRWLATALLCIAPLVVALDLAIMSFTHVLAADSYWADQFRGQLLLGLAIPFSLVHLAVAAVARTFVRAEGEHPWIP
jgi:hypothetical protein